jgi:hypothetical protein
MVTQPAADSAPELGGSRSLLIELLVSSCAFLLKARFFPGFDAFSRNFAGNSWDHVTLALLIERFQWVVSSLNIAPVLVGSLMLAAFDVRYLTGVVLLAPLYLAHLLSVQPEHGHFALYYALPWLLPVTLWLAVFVRRAGGGSYVSGFESAVVVMLSLAMAAPFHAAVGATGQRWYVARWALTRPVTNMEGMKEFALWVRGKYVTQTGDRVIETKECMSMGIAALIPNDIQPDEVLDAESDLSACRSLLLLRVDMTYDALSARAAARRFVRVAERYNAEMWMMTKNR